MRGRSTWRATASRSRCSSRSWPTRGMTGRRWRTGSSGTRSGAERSALADDDEALSVGGDVVHGVDPAWIVRLEEQRVRADRGWDVTLRLADLHGDQPSVVPVVELPSVATPYGMYAASRRDEHASTRRRVRVEIDLCLSRRVGGVRDPASIGRDARRGLARRRRRIRTRRRSVGRLHEHIVAVRPRFLGDEQCAAVAQPVAGELVTIARSELAWVASFERDQLDVLASWRRSGVRDAGALGIPLRIVGIDVVVGESLGDAGVEVG